MLSMRIQLFTSVNHSECMKQHCTRPLTSLSVICMFLIVFWSPSVLVCVCLRPDLMKPSLILNAWSSARLGVLIVFQWIWSMMDRAVRSWRAEDACFPIIASNPRWNIKLLLPSIYTDSPSVSDTNSWVCFNNTHVSDLNSAAAWLCKLR